MWETNAFVQSGILGVDARLSNVTGARVELPFFAPLNYQEERVASSNDWGIQGKGYYTTQKTSAGSQFATITYRGAAFAADDLHSYQTGEDALANIRSQLAADMNRKLQEKLQAQLTGLFGGALSEANVYTYAGNMDAQAVTGARYCLGHKSQTVTTMVVHPCVAHDLEILGMQTFKSDSGAAGGVSYASNGIGVTDTAIRTFAGLRVIIDDTLPIDDDGNFISYLFAPGVVRTGAQFGLQIEQERNILSLQDVLAITYSNCLHVVGTSWYASTDNPDNTQLIEPANWTRVFQDPRNIPIVQLKTKASIAPQDPTGWDGVEPPTPGWEAAGGAMPRPQPTITKVTGSGDGDTSAGGGTK